MARSRYSSLCPLQLGIKLIYYAPKALNEVVAAISLLPGLYLGAFFIEMQIWKKTSSKK